MPTSAAELAVPYDGYVCALWRGESDQVRRLATWLNGRSRLGGPASPSSPPAAVSTLGGSGTSIRWHEADGFVLGYIPGVPHRCYRVPMDADPPVIPVPWSRETVPSRR